MSQITLTELPGVNHFGFWQSELFREALRSILLDSSTGDVGAPKEKGGQHAEQIANKKYWKTIL